MLQTLSIRDFAIIDAVDLELGAGLTVITGETGAGKSILINALHLLLGGRANTEVVRAGADNAQVEALFDVSAHEGVRARLVDAGMEAGDQLVVRRVVAASGRHRVYVNGALATVQTLAQLTGGLVDISGQHEHYSLLRTDAHLDLLDRVAGLGAARDAVAEAHQAVAALDARMAEIHARQRDRGEREAFLRFQLSELEAAGLDDPAEEDELELECRRLRNAERLRETAEGASRELYEANGAAVERLERAARSVAELAELDPELAAVAEDLNTAHALAEDAAHTVRRYARGVSADPDHLAEIEERLALFSRLRRKYGATLADVIAHKSSLESELADLGGGEDQLAELSAARAGAAATLLAAADKLTAARRAGAARLAETVHAELADLGMDGAILEVALTPLASGVEVEGRFVGPRGADRVEFLLSANPGSPPQPLARIASGGELSRFMLAVKRAIAARDPVSTYIFDEVDTGVGGPTADAIGRKLRAVSASRQAICITHLPQIAAFGAHHLHVSKTTDGGRTSSRVDVLDDAARIEELARMLGGARITAATRAHAQEMLEGGRTAASA